MILTLADYDGASVAGAVGVGIVGLLIVLFYLFLFVYLIVVFFMPVFIYRIMRRQTENNETLLCILHEIRRRPPALPEE
jgi:hypothetical protein